MISPFAQVTDMSGRRAIGTGLMTRPITTGFPAHGYSLQKSAYCGLRVIGAGVVMPTSGTGVTGARKSASTAESITASSISAWGLWEDAGITVASSIIAPLPT